MRTIDHLPSEEQQHYIQCDCGEYIDMRNLSEVFEHLHAEKNIKPEWSYAVKVGEPKAYSKFQINMDLN